MSLDFYIREAGAPRDEQEPCRHCGQSTTVTRMPAYLFDTNITHNLTPMWRAAGVYDALYESEGKTAASVIDVLRAGAAAMEREPARFRALDAPNGWGTYADALPWLRNVLAACVEHPDGVIEVSR